MSGGRHTKPLFELLRDESSEGRRPVARAPFTGIPAPELKPARAPSREPAPVREAPARDPHHAGGSPAAAATPPRGGVVSLTLYGAYLGIAAVLAVTVIIWVVAYNSGRQRAERELGERLRQDDGSGGGDPRSLVQTPRDPLHEPLTPAPSAEPPRSIAPPPQQARAAQPQQGENGLFESDPRKPKLNYAVFATRLPRDEARELVTFLSKSGLDVIGVQELSRAVDRSGKADNNPALFKVVSTVGITSDEYRNRDPSRSRLEAEAVRLGELWKKTKTGRLPFSSLYWEMPKP